MSVSLILVPTKKNFQKNTRDDASIVEGASLKYWFGMQKNTSKTGMPNELTRFVTPNFCRS